MKVGKVDSGLESLNRFIIEGLAPTLVMLGILAPLRDVVQEEVTRSLGSVLSVD